MASAGADVEMIVARNTPIEIVEAVVV
jgi:hypothetical protein